MRQERCLIQARMDLVKVLLAHDESLEVLFTSRHAYQPTRNSHKLQCNGSTIKSVLNKSCSPNASADCRYNASIKNSRRVTRCSAHLWSSPLFQDCASVCTTLWHMLRTRFSAILLVRAVIVLSITLRFRFIQRMDALSLAFAVLLLAPQ